jgi:hypothetical protein
MLRSFYGALICIFLLCPAVAQGDRGMIANPRDSRELRADHSLAQMRARLGALRICYVERQEPRPFCLRVASVLQLRPESALAVSNELRRELAEGRLDRIADVGLWLGCATPNRPAGAVLALADIARLAPEHAPALQALLRSSRSSLWI